jgi:hypothetical protein
MVRKGGPSNSIHNWLDMACRGFSKDAREEYLNNQQSERDIRNRTTGRRQNRKSNTNRPAIAPMQGLILNAQNMPQGTIGNGSPGLIPAADFQQVPTGFSNSRPAGSPGNAQIPANAIQKPQVPRSLQNTERGQQPSNTPRNQSKRRTIGAGSTAMAIAQLHNLSLEIHASRQTQVNNGHNTQLSVMALAEAARASTARVPTDRADLLDIGRTYIEGMRVPSGYLHSRHSRR